MYWTITPISSMWPSSMIVGEPPGLISAMLLPATSVVTRSANVAASSRQTRAAGPSKPDGAGVSSNRLRNASEDGLSMWRRMRFEGIRKCVVRRNEMEGIEVGAWTIGDGARDALSRGRRIGNATKLRPRMTRPATYQRRSSVRP